ncbi:MAG: UDP-3-O-(3-hydroxymyristoyl)glucosamine N-acyltransferase [Pseudomonadota bacterium]|nr:MAG: UDP-3-O-(3-hydroxymyristoyl)glucosamine N-acyltransferase [Pseudomonadota bacterium]
MSVTLEELARRVGGEVQGDGECRIDSVGTLIGASAGQISFLSNVRYKRHLKDTQASAVIISPDDLAASEYTGNAIVSQDPYLAYAKVAVQLNPGPPARQGIHASAVVDATAVVHESAWLGPNCVIEANALIGERVQIGAGSVVGEGTAIGADTVLLPNVTLCHGVKIGMRGRIHPGAVIGSDGFGIALDGGRWTKVPQLGSVQIGDDVEIGANTTVDRGAIDSTIIEDGAKLDNQIQIAHNVIVGAHTAIAGCVGIAGSTRIGKHCAIGGGVGIAGHLEIADHVTLTGGTTVLQSIRRSGVYSSGAPVETNQKWHRNYLRIKQLDEMARRLKELESRLLDEAPGNEE